MKKDSVKINDCTYDVMTMIYYARCINYSKYNINDKIPISLYLDGEVNDTLYIRYLGSEKIKTALGEKNCIIFSPLLIKGTIFSGGEGMKVWVTENENTGIDKNANCSWRNTSKNKSGDKLNFDLTLYKF